ncbi:MAG: hypothetical protein ACREI7_13825, partial [Myxococcota bacterium]
MRALAPATPPWGFLRSAALAASLAVVVAQGVALVWLHTDRRNDLAQLDARLASQERALESASKALAAEQQQRRALESAGAAEEVASLRASLAELTTPQLDVPIVDLDARSATRNASPEDIVTVDLPRDARL